MTKEQFNTLLHSPSTINLNMVKGLEEITQQFPYFRNAHLLLAKQYQGHENIRYEGYLRKAAAYAADRRMLYDLIKLEPATIIHMHRDEPEIELNRQPETATPAHSENQVPQNETMQSSLQEILQSEMAVADKFDYELSEAVTEQTNPVISIEQEEILDDSTSETSYEEETTESNIEHPHSETTTSSTADIEPVSEKIEVEENDAPIEYSKVVSEQPENKNVIPEILESIEEVQEPEPIAESEMQSTENISESDDPKEILEQRLREIAKPSNQEPQVTEQEEEKVEETQQTPEPVSFINQKIEEVSKPVEIIETAKEKPAPLKEEIKKPIEHHTFLDWLKLKDIPVLPVDRNRDYFEKIEPRHLDADGNPIDPEDELIDNFIKTEPRIVPAKSEFYSPGNMARQSAMEHEDLISETLARIYAQQGNIPKAIDAYRRLSLKIPEKSSYFAALIRELEEQDPS